MPPSDSRPAAPPMQAPAPQSISGHPLLGRTASIRLLRYAPDAAVALHGPEEIVPFVTAIAHTQALAGQVARGQPHAEVSYLDAQGRSVATAVFADAQSPGVLATTTDAWQLSAEESATLRALMAARLTRVAAP
ncbi:MAG: hypothetical protein R3A48_24650 [Polyangiales bacterium]